MGILAIDIETTSPFHKQEYVQENLDKTEVVELLAVGIGYKEDIDGEITDSTVIFRQGSLGDEYTAKTIEKVCEWISNFNVEKTITFNGNRFDKTHLLNWSEQVNEYVESDLVDCIRNNIFGTHIDIRQLSTDNKFEDQLESDGVDFNNTYYTDYFNSVQSNKLAMYAGRWGGNVNEFIVEGRDIGNLLGILYIHKEFGLEDYYDDVVVDVNDYESINIEPLKEMIFDYTINDIHPMFELYKKRIEYRP